MRIIHILRRFNHAEKVPEYSLAIARSRQVVKTGLLKDMIRREKD